MGKKRIRKKRGEQTEPEVGALFDRVVAIMDRARDRVVRRVNHEMLIAYWHIGREIVEQVQEGKGRAAYGRAVLGELSKRLTKRYGRGFSFTNLKYFRQFYKAYAIRQPEIGALSEGHSGPETARPSVQAPGGRLHKSCDEPGIDPSERSHHEALEESSASARPIGHKPCDQLDSRDEEGVALPGSDQAMADLECAAQLAEPFSGFAPNLSWSHYRTLTKVANRAERQFYEIEANAQGWSVPQLARQIDTSLFARLLKSRDKAGVLELSTEGQVIESPVDALKDPYVLDFLNLPDSEALHESDLEAAILHKLRAFLLELGKGFAFVARQQRLSFEDEHFYVDLVFFNITLKCYLLIDLKVGKLTHQDIGQMDSYVRLFDDQCTSDDDNPTIGLILCAHRNEAIARYSVLHESEQLFAARYVQVLPSVEEFERELQREHRRLDQRRHGR